MKLRGKSIINFTFYFVLILFFLRSELHFPTGISYIIDFTNIILVLFLIISKKKCIKWVLGFMILFLTYCLFTVFYNGGSILLVLWALRSNFRFYIFFAGCVAFFSVEDYTKIICSLKYIFAIDVVLVTIQYFALNKSGDFLGGLFGTDSGCNGHSNIFLIICCTFAIVSFLNGCGSIKNVIFTILSSCYIAILSELKCFFIEIFIIVIIALLITNFSIKKLVVALVSGVGLIGIVIGIGFLYPDFANTFTLAAIYAYANNEVGYTGQGDLNRLNAIVLIKKRLSHTDEFNQFVGIGFGNGEYSYSFDFLKSQFYLRYEYWHYYWFSYVWIFLELGYIGLFIFEFFYIYIFIKGILILKKNNIKNKESKMLIHGAMIVAIVSVFLSVFNVSLRVESGFLIYAVLAMPFVALKTTGAVEH